MIVLARPPRTLDPHAAAGSSEARILEGLYEGLVRLDPDTGRAVPGLASSWETTPDGRRWTFHLREGLLWSDGSPLTAKDFAWSWRRSLAPSTAGEFAYLLDRVRHVAAWRRSRALDSDRETTPFPAPAAIEAARTHFGVDQGAFALDDRTFVVELDAYVPWLLDLLAMPFAAPVHRPSVEGGRPSAFTAGQLVSCGAFRLEPAATEDRIRLRKSPTYWDAASTGCETLEAVAEEDRTAAVALFEDGRADWVLGVDRALAARVPPHPDLVVSPSDVLYFLRVQTKRPALSDARVRRALSRAIDRDRLFSSADRVGLPTANVVPAGYPGYESPKSRIGFDLADARSLLAGAGYPEGKGFPAITYLLNEDVGHRAMAEGIRRQWKEHLGIETTLRVETWSAYQERLQSGEFDVARGGWIGDFADPMTFLGLFRAGDPNNHMGWSDPFYEQLMDLASDPIAGSRSLGGPDALAAFFNRFPVREDDTVVSKFDREADLSTSLKRYRLGAWRLALLQRAERILVEDAVPAIPLCVYLQRDLVAPRVEGFRRTLSGSDGSPRPNLFAVHPLRALRVRKG